MAEVLGLPLVAKTIMVFVIEGFFSPAFDEIPAIFLFLLFSSLLFSSLLFIGSNNHHFLYINSFSPSLFLFWQFLYPLLSFVLSFLFPLFIEREGLLEAFLGGLIDPWFIGTNPSR
jgi:hypothetical protein